MTAISEVENKVHSASGLVQKTDYDAKIKSTEAKYFTTADCNNFLSNILDLKIKRPELVNKSDIDKKLIHVNKKITSSKTKNFRSRKKKLHKYQKKDLIILLGRTYFTGDVIIEIF